MGSHLRLSGSSLTIWGSKIKYTTDGIFAYIVYVNCIKKLSPAPDMSHFNQRAWKKNV